MKKILIFGEDTRSFLTIVRSFGKRGFAIDVCPFDFTSPALTSKYITNIFRTPPYNIDPSEWIQTITKIMENNQYDFIIPCDDRSIIPLMLHKEDINNQPIALPNNKAFEIFYNKHKTREYAQKCGVPVAEGRLLNENDTSPILISQFDLPLAIKPISSYTVKGLATRNKVSLVHDRKHLEKILSTIKRKHMHSDHIVEKFFTGFGVGLSVLANKGEILHSFQHQRANEPITGGGSSYRLSVPVHPILAEYVSAISRETQLTGVAMFEFRQDFEKADHFILVEVNARFWGSLPLAVSAGVDFPYLLYEMQANNTIIPFKGYKTPYFGRNVTADFYYTLAAFSIKRKENGLSALIFLVKSTILCVTRIFLLKEKHDSFSWKDPKPYVNEIKNLAAIILKSVTKKIPVPTAYKAWKIQRKIKRCLPIAPKSGRIMFLCSGNICRSPFAALLFKEKWADHRIDLEITSSGLLPMVNRRSPENAVTCAQEWGIDLGLHRSNYATNNDLTNADLIITFDDLIANKLAARKLHLHQKTLCLSEFISNTGSKQIIDPYGRGLDGFRKVYRQIDDALDKLINQMA